MKTDGGSRSKFAPEETWIPRQCLFWLLAAQLALIAPHVERLPLWVDGAWLLSAAWRVQVYRGRWSFPPSWFKAPLAIGCFFGIRYSYGTWVGLEPTVALLITGFSLKLLEAAQRRDAFLLLFLGFFVALTEFLFEQGLGTVLYMLLPVLLLTTALVALQQYLKQHDAQQQSSLRFSWQPLRTAAAIAAQALPLMLLLFLVFPRIAPLWSVPLPGTNAQTGMSDHMEPGDISQLSQSDALAFRVAFAGPVPPHTDLYWRGMALEEFDGRRWRANNFSDVLIGQEKNLEGPALDYQVYMEPTYQRWLYALQRPTNIDTKTFLTRDYQLQARDIVADKFTYRVRSYPQAAFGVDLNARARKRELALPGQSNPRTRAWVKPLREQFEDDDLFIEQVLKNFREQSFYYTLKPPLLGENSIDEFLFDTRRGFCEHYASSFVFVLRAAGIPARVVVGYQGGEINPLTGTVLVHQFDAHAWAEAWLPQRGWVRFDPTAAVAPQRIENGLESAVSGGEFLAQSPLSANRYRNIGWLNTLRLRVDMINYSWTRWVVNYRDDTQTQVLQNLIGEINPWRIGLLLLGGGGSVLVIVMLLLLGKQLFGPHVPPEQKYYQRICKRLARAGYPRPLGMAPGPYAKWLLAQKPQWREIEEITSCYEALSYRRITPHQRQQLLARMRLLVGKASIIS